MTTDQKDQPEQWKIYKLTAGPGEPCIFAGNTWEESEVKEGRKGVREEGNRFWKVHPSDRPKNGEVRASILEETHGNHNGDPYASSLFRWTSYRCVCSRFDRNNDDRREKQLQTRAEAEHWCRKAVDLDPSIWEETNDDPATTDSQD